MEETKQSTITVKSSFKHYVRKVIIAYVSTATDVARTYKWYETIPPKNKNFTSVVYLPRYPYLIRRKRNTIGQIQMCVFLQNT